LQTTVIMSGSPVILSKAKNLSERSFGVRLRKTGLAPSACALG